MGWKGLKVGAILELCRSTEKKLETVKPGCIENLWLKASHKGMKILLILMVP